MSIFRHIKTYFKKRKIKTKLSFLLKRLDKKEKLLNSNVMKKIITNDLISNYNFLKINNVDQDVLFRYDNITSKIHNHNNKINVIENKIKTFDINKYINNPIKLTLKDFVKYDEVCLLIESFNKRTKESIKFIDEVSELKNNLDIIKQQFLIKEKAKDIYESFFRKDKYHDEKDKNHLLKEIVSLSNQLSKQPKIYYKFKYLETISNDINKHNEAYIKRNLNNPIFDNINGKKLSDDQKSAILTDSISNLVIAGAGSGKTLTICGKAKYLLDEKKIPKEDIIFLSYSKSSANDLEKKLKNIEENLNVSTFHSLGLKIIESEKLKKQNVESNYDAIIERYFSTEMFSSQNSKILRKILDFQSKYTYSLIYKKYETKGDKFENLKEANFKTLKDFLTNVSNTSKLERETILKENVKSFEELAIANFYFLNGISYQYEKPFPIDTSTFEYRQYNPDFTLIDYDIYHEHYGVDRKGRCTQYTKSEEVKYIQSMNWKDEFHEKQKTKYIKTYSYEFSEEIIFENLEKQLISLGVKIEPISELEMRNVLKSIYNNRDFKSFIKLIKTFISLYKAKYNNETFFEKLKLEKFDNAYERKRGILFLDICKEVYLYYKSQLNGKIDFDDMIFKAIDIIPKRDDFKYKYIIVDEFQDMSFSKMKLLRALIKHGNSKIFAVGDDWQSIYRFAGNDISIFINFDNYFDMTTETKLLNNYRNPKQLHDIIEPFITANPEQKKKDIVCSNELNNPVKIVYYEKSKVSALNYSLKEIYKVNPKANVFLLGRNNFDIEDYLSTNIKMDNKGNINHFQFKSMNISFKTVHRSKGLEEEFVIVLNNEDSKIGFPNKIEDDSLLSLVLSEKSRYEFSEERRLFYVALTRAKGYCYLLVDSQRPSIFIKEIENRCEVLNPNLIQDSKKIFCPNCKTGNLVIRGDWNNQFYGCSNYPYCPYTQEKRIVESSKRCPRCGHFIIWRDGNFGKFLGCSNYPSCPVKITPREIGFGNWKPTFKKRKK